MLADNLCFQDSHGKNEKGFLFDVLDVLINKSMTNILFINHATGWGGASLNMVNIINALDKSKFKAKVLLIKDSGVRKVLENNGIECLIAPTKFYKKYYQYFSHGSGGHKWYHIITLVLVSIGWLFSRFYFSKRVLRNIDCDIIHLNSSALTDWLYASHKKAKTVIHFQEAMAKGYFGLRRAFFRCQVNKYADHIVAISNDNADRLNLPEKTTVVYNYTELMPDVEIWNSDVNNKVLYVGGAQEIKGFFTLVASLDYLAKDIRVYFCGFYPVKVGKKLYQRLLYYKKNKQLLIALTKMRTHQNAVVIGMVNTITPLIDATAVMVSPFAVEHFSRPVIEAFARKKPAIGTNVEGMDEIIDHKINGLIVDKQNPEALAAAINEMCSNTEGARQMGENGYKKAGKLFSPINIKKIENIYDNLTYNDHLKIVRHAK